MSGLLILLAVGCFIFALVCLTRSGFFDEAETACPDCGGEGYQTVAIGGDPDRTVSWPCECAAGERFRDVSVGAVERADRDSGPDYERAVDAYRLGD